MVEPVTIGNATLYLGDCRDILPTLGEVDAVVTDVPYGKRAVAERVENGLRTMEFGEWDNEQVAFDALRLLSECPSVLAFCSDQQLSLVFQIFEGRSGRTLGWKKTNPTVVNAQYLFQPSLELAAYSKGAGAWFGGSCVPSVWEGPAPHQSERFHPTQKPVGLMRWAVQHTVAPGTICCDPFMGSGTTGVAAVQMGRKFIGIEREPKYFEIACRRIEEAQRQADMFIAPDPAPRPVQEGLL